LPLARRPRRPIREVDRWSRVRQGEVGHHRLRQRRPESARDVGSRSRTPPRDSRRVSIDHVVGPRVFLGEHLPGWLNSPTGIRSCGVSRTTISPRVGDLPGADRSRAPSKIVEPARTTDGLPNSGRCAETGQARGIISLHGGPLNGPALVPVFEGPGQNAGFSDVNMSPWSSATCLGERRPCPASTSRPTCPRFAWTRDARCSVDRRLAPTLARRSHDEGE